MSVAINSNYYAGYTMNSANKFKNVSDYSKYLTNKYKCLTPCKNASVLIDRSVMQKACGDEKTAKWLEENLAIIKERHLKSFVLCNESDETNIDQRKQYRYLYQRAMDSKDFDSFMKLAV